LVQGAKSKHWDVRIPHCACSRMAPLVEMLMLQPMAVPSGNLTQGQVTGT